MNHQIEVTVAADGETKVEVKGAVGRQCADLTQALESALGTVTQDVRRPEFYQQAKQTQKFQQ
jgi:hypothetical protein